MFFESDPQSRRFLALATKVWSGMATNEEQEELRSMTRQNEKLEQELERMQRETRLEREDRLMVMFLRVLFGTASPAEVADVMALATKDPKQWVAFQHLRVALEEIGAGESQPAEGSVSEAALKRISEKALSRLKPR